ncbi:MAG: HAMP domain-containing protein [Desulfatiglandales bacterium]
MIVICEECGKKYQIDAGRIKGKQARFKCKGCGHPVTVTKPAEEPAPAPPRPEPGAGASAGETGKEKKKKEKKDKKEKKAAGPKRLGLRTKMFLLFFLVPILCIAAAGWLYIQQFNNLSSLITDQSSDVVNQMGEDLIARKAKTVANQVEIYLDANPGLQKEDFNTDPEFRKIVVQPVGETGYTCIYTVPDEDGVSSLWAHPNENLIGVDMKEAMQKALGKGFPAWWKVYSGAFEGKVSGGYYPWQDADGEIRDKFMICTPIENTPYVVASTTYMYEFTHPMDRLQARAGELTNSTINTIMAIVAGTIILIGVIVMLFGHRLTRRIQSLTDVTERISVGELDADVEIESKDEIEDLGDAVSRMQDSIRLSIERLRRRR